MAERLSLRRASGGAQLVRRGSTGGEGGQTRLPRRGSAGGGRRASAFFNRETSVGDKDRLEDEFLKKEHASRKPEKDPCVLALKEKALFKHCSQSFLCALVASANQRSLEPGQEETLHPKTGVMLVVEHGAVNTVVGPGPPVVTGAGTVLNAAGLAGCAELMETLPPSTASPADYEVFDFPSSGTSGFSVYDARLPEKDMVFLGGLTGDQLCFHSLCPHASRMERRASLKHVVQGSLPVKIVAGLPGECPMMRCDRADFMTGGVSLIEIDMHLIKSVGLAFKLDFERFQKNVADMQRRFQLVLEKIRKIFIAAPAEVYWAIAETMVEQHVYEKTTLVQEGSTGSSNTAASSNMIITVNGTCIVKKNMGVSPHEARDRPIGKLHPGAIIGDWCLFAANLPRAASVAAETELDIIVLPNEKIMEIMRRLPGTLAGMENRLNKVASFIRTRLSGKALESLLNCNIFSGCNEAFLTEVAEAVESRTYLCGQSIFENEDDDLDLGESSKELAAPTKRTGSKPPATGEHKEDTEDEIEEDIESGTMLYALESGTCVLQTPGRGVHLEIVQGNSLKTADLKRADFCVSSPIALVLCISMKSLREIITRYPQERPRFLRKFDPAAVMRSVIRQIEAFKPCCNGFVDDLTRGMTCSSYMPGQTVVVMGAEDNQQMFMLRRGQVAVEVGGKKVADMKAGATFGEVVMLGVTQSRTATVRAMTFSTMLEIPRVPFWEAIERFPEERSHFEQLALRNMKITTTWPILQGVPSRLGLLLFLQAARRTVPAGDQSFNNERSRESALLVLSGMVALMNAEGKEIETFVDGQCFNEQILIGIPNYDGSYLVPKVSSELQIVSAETWEKVVSAFPAEKNTIRRNIFSYMSRRAEKRLGFEANSTAILRQAALFRISPEVLLEHLVPHLEPRVFKPGEAIVVAGQEGDTMHILLDGLAFLGKSVGGSRPVAEFGAGSAVGEAVMIGAAKAHPCTVRAKTLCIVRSLARKDLLEVLETLGPEVQKDFDELLADARAEPPATLLQKLKKTAAFKSCNANFLTIACKDADDVLFAPGDALLRRGEVCKAGESPIYVILSGAAMIEGELGVALAEVAAGEITGEGAAMGLSSRRTATVRAGKNRFVHCARLHGGHLEAALKSSEGGQEQFLADLHSRRQTDNKAAMARWASWLETKVIPALRGSPVFTDWSVKDIKMLVAPLSEDTYPQGEVIAQAGTPADTMIVLLQGEAEVETKNGMVIGHLKEGATIGGEVVMGLFTMRTSTVRATVPCTVLMLPATELQRVVETPGADDTREQFTKLKERKISQVEAGLPMSALPLGVGAEDLCARAVALQASFHMLAPGETFHPTPDSGHGGPHFGVLVSGRACFEVGSDTRPIFHISQGFLVPEGLVAKHNARLRALTACDYYTVRKSDFVSAVDSIPVAQAWYPRFRLLEKQVRRQLITRLQSAHGATVGLQAHRHSADLVDWKMRREETVAAAVEMRKEHQERVGPPMEILDLNLEQERPKSSQGLRRSNSSPTEKLLSYPILTVLTSPARHEVKRPSSSSSASRKMQQRRAQTQLCW
mmetsp:Transcript_50552/g.90724  ORF Transcript_50552/g.90724 Transcript_50552/m.90724 type:complete len:1564 (-) Transcript_50552:67-4758(-)